MLISADEEDAEILKSLVQKARECKFIEKSDSVFYPFLSQVKIVFISGWTLNIEEYLDDVGYGIHTFLNSFFSPFSMSPSCIKKAG